MKNPAVLILFLFVCLGFASCLKENLSKNSSSGNTNSSSDTTVNENMSAPTILSGKWALVNDTTTTGFWGIWSGRASIGKNYIGQPGDYYNFGTYGQLSIHQDSSSYTQAYKISKDTVMIRYAYIDGQTNQLDSAYNSGYMVIKLTNTTCTLTQFAISPETTYNSVINLKKE